MTDIALARTPELHAARAAGYRFFATAFRYPDRHVEEALASPPPGLGLEEVARARAALSGTLEDEYVRTFGHSVPKEYPPFETEFTSAQTFRQTTELADIAGISLFCELRDLLSRQRHIVEVEVVRAVAAHIELDCCK